MAAQYQAGPSRPPYGQMQPPQPLVSSPSTDRPDWGAYSPNTMGGYQQSPYTGPGQPMQGYAPMPEPRIPAPTVPRPLPARQDSLSDDTAAKRNPLEDLMETEKAYVEQLALIIKRVAGAWSRTNLPPPKLDAMFRCIETVYRANRSFGSRLKEIASNPANAKALGDLLMRWIQDLEPAYGRYVTIYLTGFDNYPPVSGNSALPHILQEVSSVTMPTPPLTEWTLDALFLLPYARLRYYRKLYARLLKNTTEGRSDHRLLENATLRLDQLVTEMEARLEYDVSEEDPATAPVPPLKSTETPRNDSYADEKAALIQNQPAPPQFAPSDGPWPNEKAIHPPEVECQSRGSSGVDSSVESHSVLSSFHSARMDSSVTSPATSVTHSPGRGQAVPTVSISNTPMPEKISDLELRIDTERTIDLFNMQPRKCRLQIQPPSLSYLRQLRSSHDGTVYFTPSSTGQQVVHRRAHLFILSDLFLITDRMEANEKASKAQQVAREQPNRVGEGGPMPEMWLAYPPLAGKHLSVVEGAQSNVVAVTVMRRETFVIHAESEMERDQMLKSLTECIEFATARAGGAIPNSAGPMADPRGTSFGNPRSPPPVTSPVIEQRDPMNNIVTPMRQMSMESGNENNAQALPPRGASLRKQTTGGSQQSQFSEASTFKELPQAPRQLPPREMLSPLTVVTTGGNTPGGLSPAQSRGPSLLMQSPQSPLSVQSMPALGLQQPPNLQPPQQAQYNQQQQYGYSPQQQQGQLPPQQYERHSPQQQYSQVPQQPYGPPGQQQYGGPQFQGVPNPQQFQPNRLRDDLPAVPGNRIGSGAFSERGVPSYPERQLPVRAHSAEPLALPESESIQPPSARFGSFVGSSAPSSPHPDVDEEDVGPAEEQPMTLTGPTVITAQMKCKVFLQHGHAQWKSLGHAKLKLYAEKGGRSLKQLVVESESKKGGTLISTIVLTDAVERVGKTGVAVEVSDQGLRTGIIYMLQLRNEQSAAGLHESLLAGSDRNVRR